MRTGEFPSFAELHCLTNHSFLRGASHPEELIDQAHALGYTAIAITDECTYAGLAKAYRAARERKIKLIVGAEFNVPLPDETLPDAKLVVLVPDRTAYGQLSTLISKFRGRADKGSYQAQLKDFHFNRHSQNKHFLVLWNPPLLPLETLVSMGETLQKTFAHLWISLELFRQSHDLDQTSNALTLSTRLGLRLVASNDVHTHCRTRQPLQDLVTAIRLNTTVDNIGFQGFPNAERTLRSRDELQELYPAELLEESVAIADRCHFSMAELRYEYPQDLVPAHLTPTEYLRQLTMAGARQRWPGGTPIDTQKIIDKELALIEELKYEHYFLTVQDIAHFARSQSILCQGRGSAANSAVCYCLHVTDVDPDRMSLLFERFISKERQEPPDIDIDFEHERREEVIQYIYKRYGRDRAALSATLICYRPRSAIRDVGKALGLNLDLLGILAKSMAWWDKKEEIPARLRSAGLDPDSLVAKQFIYFVNQILGFPRHLSQHVGGFVISRGPLVELVPIENAAMPDRTIIQWDKDDLETLGLFKVDILALGMLTAIRKALDTLNDYKGTNLRVDQIPREDPKTYEMLQAGDSVGVFQVESRAQMSMLPRLKPRHFYDLVIEVAIVRPGPIQGDMVHPYLRRREGREAVEYLSQSAEKVLERTLGIPIFQEQVIELAMVMADFTAGEADQLRRAMAAWKKRGGLELFEQKLIAGMLKNGHDEAFAKRLFEQIKGFGDYGFPESHAASFALLVYVSSWLKCHEPAAFYCGLLNSLPMGFYSPSQLIQDAQRHNIAVYEIDVCISNWEHTLEGPGGEHPPGLRLGLTMIKGLREEQAERLVIARQHRPFRDIQDLANRAQLNNQAMGFLARAGALTQLSGHRHQAHWQVAGIARPLPIEQSVADESPEYTEQSVNHADEAAIIMPAPSTKEDLLDDYRYTGLTLGPHPMALLRQQPDFAEYRVATDLEHCRHGQLVRIAGLVTGRQRPGTATGVVFLTVEDETGNINVIVWASVLQRFRAALLQGQLLKIKGVVERSGSVIHVVAGHVVNATDYLRDLSEAPLPFKSRDFH